VFCDVCGMLLFSVVVRFGICWRLGSDLRTFDSQIDCCFSCYYILLVFARMDASKDRLIRNITIAATALCAALLLTTDYGPQPHALTPVFATPLCVSVEYSGTSFPLWNCVPRFAESVPVSVVFRITC
jgi:hypothetical protein